MRKLTQWSLGFTLAGALLYTAPAFGLLPPLVYEMTSESVPKGRYVFHHRPPVAEGEVVALRDPRDFNLPLLFKRVVATTGDQFCWDAQARTHRLNGRLMPPPLPAAVAAGIPVWHGCQQLQAGEIVGYGDGPDSYDSRYLGVIREAELWGSYVLLR